VRVRAITTALLSLMIVLWFAPTSSVFSADSDTTILLFTVAKRYEPLAWIRGTDRFSSDAILFLQDSSSRHPLVPHFAASADPSVSFDGKRVLFAGKQTVHDAWQIWEVGITGAAPRRITSCAADCVRPFYLPDDRLVYAKKTGARFVIEAADLGRDKTVQLTYGPGNFLPTDVLRDGRILFEAAYPLGPKGTPELYTVYSDGSGVESYRCDHGNARHSGKQFSSGDIVFAGNSGLGRFSSARAQEISVSAPSGDYAGEVAETAEGDWLLAWRPDAKSDFQVKRWKPGERDLVPVVAEVSANVIQPTLVAERIVPNRHPSALHDWPNANLLCLNAYTSKYKFAAGSIHSVRLYTRGSAGTAKLLGTAPVERDGSFFVQVPTEQPLQMELLDGFGRTLKRQAGWFWMRRGEQRACVGCHTGPETAPENTVPMILLKSTTPADMTGASAHTSSGGH
jgi:Hydrazine synthase alpha subunit middle domain